MTGVAATAEVAEGADDLRRVTIRKSGTALLWVGGLLNLAGLATAVASWTVFDQATWAPLAVAIGCYNIVAGANFAWWGDRFRHYSPLFPSGPWGAVFATGCLAVGSVVAVAVLLYANYWLVSTVIWFQSK